MQKLNDTEIFLHSQSVYLSITSTEQETKEAWFLMWQKIKKCCAVQFHKFLLKKRLHLRDEDVEDVIEDATVMILNRYSKYKKKGKEYRIKNIVSVCYLALVTVYFWKEKKLEKEKEVIDIFIQDLIYENGIDHNDILDIKEDIDNEYF